MAVKNVCCRNDRESARPHSSDGRVHENPTAGRRKEQTNHRYASTRVMRQWNYSRRVLGRAETVTRRSRFRAEQHRSFMSGVRQHTCWRRRVRRRIVLRTISPIKPLCKRRVTVRAFEKPHSPSARNPFQTDRSGQSNAEHGTRSFSGAALPRVSADIFYCANTLGGSMNSIKSCASSCRL